MIEIVAVTPGARLRIAGAGIATETQGLMVTDDKAKELIATGAVRQRSLADHDGQRKNSRRALRGTEE